MITGASGFIGGFLVREALYRGYDVWAATRPGSSRVHLYDKRIHFIYLHYEDKDALTKQLIEVASSTGAWHYVIHNAGITKALHKADFYKVNVQNTSVLLEALEAANCRPEKFLLMSSLSSYGPINERSLKPLRTDDQQKPDSEYGKSKLQAERIVKEQSYFPFIILCPTGVYGPGDKDYLMEIKSIRLGIDMKAGMKPQHITFIYVKDLVLATFLALEKPSALNTTCFMADGDVYTDREFADIVKNLLGKRFVLNMRLPLWLCFTACFCSEWIGKILKKTMTLNTDKFKILRQRNWICETEQTNKELAFTPQYNLKKGLEETIRYCKKQGIL